MTQKNSGRVLLVEPDYKSRFPPLPLLKFSTYFKKMGFQVKYARGKIPIKNDFDEIVITTLFSTDWKECVNTINHYVSNYPDSRIRVGGIYASLLPNHLYKHTGIRPFIGCIQEIDECAPDYSLIPRSSFNNTSNIITSRGCPNCCKFCGTNILEPDLRIVKNWKKHFLENGKFAVIHDNNILVFGDDHLFDVLNYLKVKKINCLFDNGFDCRLFTAKHAAMLKHAPITEIRFAFDTMEQDGFIQEAIGNCLKVGIKPYKIKVFILYNYQDTPEEALYRAKEVRSMGATPFPMRYRPLNWLNPDKIYISKNWEENDLYSFSSYLFKYWVTKKYDYTEWKEKRKELLRKSEQNTRSRKIRKEKNWELKIQKMINSNMASAKKNKDRNSIFGNKDFIFSYLKNE